MEQGVQCVLLGFEAGVSVEPEGRLAAAAVGLVGSGVLPGERLHDAEEGIISSIK